MLFYLISAEFVLSNLEGHVGNDERDDNLEGYNKVLDENGEEDNGSSIPTIGVTLTQVSHQDWLLTRLKIVKILEYARGFLWEASEEQNCDVHGDGEVRDEAHDLHPVSNATCALSSISFTILGDVLDLD